MVQSLFISAVGQRHNAGAADDVVQAVGQLVTALEADDYAAPKTLLTGRSPER